jgi:hypothetical protein
MSLFATFTNKEVKVISAQVPSRRGKCLHVFCVEARVAQTENSALRRECDEEIHAIYGTAHQRTASQAYGVHIRLLAQPLDAVDGELRSSSDVTRHDLLLCKRKEARAGCVIEGIPSILDTDAAEKPRPAGDGGAEILAHSLQHNEVPRAHILEAELEE